MAKIAQSHAKPSAFIVSPKDKGRKSIKNNKVYLTDGENFEIELYNPLQECVLADIKLNGQSISKTGLILKPGQRFYLDCFMDDRKKFVFNTYEIENTSESIEATQNNGLLEVFFYKENVVTINNWKNRFDRVILERWYPVYYPGFYPYHYPYYGQIYCGTGTTSGVGVCTTNITSSYPIGTTTNTSYTTGNIVGSSYTSSVNNLFTSSPLIETGRIEKGSSSSQKFTEIDMDFESNYISSTIIQMLPDSRKPFESKDLKGKLNASEIESDDVIELIKKLSDLHSAGILTDDEFSDKKSELLSKI